MAYDVSVGLVLLGKGTYTEQERLARFAKVWCNGGRLASDQGMLKCEAGVKLTGGRHQGVPQVGLDSPPNVTNGEHPTKVAETWRFVSGVCQRASRELEARQTDSGPGSLGEARHSVCKTGDVLASVEQIDGIATKGFSTRAHFFWNGGWSVDGASTISVSVRVASFP